MNGIYVNIIKRIFDIVASSLALIVLSPVFLVLTILIKIKLGSPVLFCQERIGKDNRPFNMYKFRSMANLYDENGNLLPDDIRCTNFGKKLRATSLDELPEFIHIFKGDMSFVGPRPLPTEYLPYYNDIEIHRHDVLPGLTGWAQVNGRTALAWDKRFEYDVEYVKGCSLWMDLKIVFLTIKKVLMKSDVVAAGHQGNFSEFRKKQWEEEKNV